MVYYKLKEFYKDPRTNFEDKKWYAVPYAVGTLETDDLAEIVAERSGHSKGQLVGLFQDYFRRIEKHVLMGQSVSMSPIGTIIPTLNGAGADSEEEYSADLIDRLKLHLRAGSGTSRRLQTVSNGGELTLKKWGE